MYGSRWKSESTWRRRNGLPRSAPLAEGTVPSYPEIVDMRHLLLSFFLPCVSLAWSETARGEETPSPDPAEGHSYHGEAFNEGPRQAAVLIPGTGDVHFPVTTDSDEAQRFFDQGIGQLHGYWYLEAERSFRQAAAIDPGCAMTYWGMAMANFKNDTRGKGFIDEAVERIEGVSTRERLWIEGLASYFADTKKEAKDRRRAWIRAIEKVIEQCPEDIEARAFLLHQIYDNSRKGIPIPSHFAINLLAENILSEDPDHPANHYRIHLWDREKPAKALTAAASCGSAAPAIAHMWHMPGHIYSRLHRYADAVWQQEASARVDHAHMIRFRIVPDRIHNFAHNNEWCIRNMNYLGQYERSVALAANMISLPRVAKFKKEKEEDVYDPKGSSWYYGRIRLRDTLLRFEQWNALLEHSDDGLLQADGTVLTERDDHRFRGIASFEAGKSADGKRHRAALAKDLAAETKERDEAVATARSKAKEENKPEKEIDAAVAEAEKTNKKDIEALENLVRELDIYEALTAEPADTERALALLPDLKNVDKSRHAWLWHRAGNGEKAIEVATAAVKAAPEQVLPLARQVRILHAHGKTEEAREAMEKLRETAFHADLDTPPLAPVAAIAREMGIKATPWTRSPAKRKDIGERPPLDSLGPFRWSPPKAPRFTLVDGTGERVSLEDYRGRSVLAIFFLGHRCSHCMEQLEAFAPHVAAYREAGIEIVGVSTDPVSELGNTRRTTDEGTEEFPFPLWSDEDRTAFRAFRAHDDFEDQPLHGTYLIDGNGRIRWQTIGHEPFSRPSWLLEECQRLLTGDQWKS